jgi:hypothetical protein
VGALRRHTRPRLTLALVQVAALLVVPLAAQQPAGEDARPASGEYVIKAAFLYNFLKYVEWPTPSKEDPLVLCVAGQNPFGTALEQFDGERINGRAVKTKVIPGAEPGCHAIFMPATSNRNVYLRAARGASVLTIGETQNFLAEGGIINFVMDGARVRFEINAEAAARENLRISSRLLQLALPTPGARGAQ